MAMKLGFSALALGASVDQQTGNLSVFEVVEEVRTPQLPIHLQSLVIALVLEKTSPNAFKGKMYIHILTPDGKQQKIGDGELQVPAEQKRMKAVFRFGGFPVMAFGEHRFVLSWTDETGAKVGEALLDFDVVKVTQVAQGVEPSDKPPVTH